MVNNKLGSPPFLSCWGILAGLWQGSFFSENCQPRDMAIGVRKQNMVEKNGESNFRGILKCILTSGLEWNPDLMKVEKKHVSCVMGGNRDGHPPSSQDP